MFDMSVIGTHVIYLSWTTATVGSTSSIVDIDTGAVGQRNLTSGTTPPGTKLAVDADFVYWADGKQILRVPRAGGNPDIVVPAANVQSKLIIDNGLLYWSSCNASDTSTILYRAPSSGGPAQRLGATTSGCDQASLAVSGGDVYLATGNDVDSIWSVPVGGGTVTSLVRNRHKPRSIFAWQGGVYWAEQATDASTKDGSIQRFQGGALTTLVSGEAVATPLAHDDQELFFTIGYSPTNTFQDFVLTVARKSLDGAGRATTMTTTSIPSSGLVAGSDSLFWYDLGGHIYRLAK